MSYFSLSAQLKSRALSRGGMLVAAILLIMAMVAPRTYAQSASISLSIAPAGGGPSASVFKFSAVVSGSGAPVTAGLVTFVDTYDGASETLGSAEVQGAKGTPGLAILKQQLGGLGVHTVKATFQGTVNFASATTTQTVSLTPGERASSTGSAGNYSLTGTIFSFNPQVLPTGTFTFTDTTSNTVLASGVALSPTTALYPFPYPDGNSPLISESGLGINNAAAAPASGDFNGDGILDLVVPAAPGQILLGNGDGTFTPGASLSSLAPSSAVVGDFDGDGNLDIAIANTGNGGSVDIYLGNGDGTFRGPTSYTEPFQVGLRMIAIGDFNRDGNQDLVVTDWLGNQVIVFLGNGDGTFQPGKTHSTAPNGDLPFNVLVTANSVNGYQDLLVGSDYSPQVSVLLGNGDGTFHAGPPVPVPGDQAGSIALADVNGDGVPDLIVSDQPARSIYTLLGNGDETFGTANPIPTLGAPYFVTTGDFNHDGHTDIVVTDRGAPGDEILINNGDGTFAPPIAYPTDGWSIFAIVGDFNGDGIDDVVTSISGNLGDLQPMGLSLLVSNIGLSTLPTPVTISGCGVQMVTATYSGGPAIYPQGTSPAISLAPSLLPLQTSLSLQASPTSTQLGQPVTLIATLTPYQNAAYGSDGELITFMNGSTIVGTAPLKAGVATLTGVTTLPAGTVNITAVYPGDCSLNPSTSSTVPVTVIFVPSNDFTFVLTSPSSVSGVYGSSGQFTFLASPLAGAAGFPGTVQFSVSGSGPIGATYTFSPASIAANAGATSITLTVTTKKLARLDRPSWLGFGGVASIGFAFCLLPFRFARRLRSSGGRLLRYSMMAILLAGSLAGFVSLTGCGAGYFAYDYPIVVTATSGGVTHSVSVAYDIEKSSQ